VISFLGTCFRMGCGDQPLSREPVAFRMTRVGRRDTRRRHLFAVQHHRGWYGERTLASQPHYTQRARDASTSTHTRRHRYCRRLSRVAMPRINANPPARVAPSTRAIVVALVPVRRALVRRDQPEPVNRFPNSDESRWQFHSRGESIRGLTRSPLALPS
jgi:hypothetical protein